VISINPQTIQQFQQKLLEWYAGNARILPWRDNPSPYRVWISEIMLQQTRVKAVLPYFERFLKEVPAIHDLAVLSEDRLLKLWEGLGYYSRAKNLKKAAGIITEQYNGELPSDRKELQSLPGIGPYTSGAIASIAFGAREPAVDGNVLRVMTRISGSRGDLQDKTTRKALVSLSELLLPAEKAGDFNQALMELGAVVCLPGGKPKCGECPVQSFCEAYRQDEAGHIPVKSGKAERRTEFRTVFIIHSNNRIAIRQRPEKGLLSGLWEFPNALGNLSLDECREVLREWGIRPKSILPLDNAKHVFTHLEWHMSGYLVQAETAEGDAGLIWAKREEIRDQYSIPSAFQAYAKYIGNLAEDSNIQENYGQENFK
jgi:A/G-specific adenine glycosylase